MPTQRRFFILMGGWAMNSPDFELWEVDPDTYHTKQMVDGGPGIKKRTIVSHLKRRFGSWKCKTSRRAGSNETAYEFTKVE